MLFRSEAQKIIEEARIRINEEKEAALKEARKELALISLTIAEKVVRKELSDDNAQKELVDRYVDEVV